MLRIAVRLTEAYRFDADSRTCSNSGSDGIFSRDSHEGCNPVQYTQASGELSSESLNVKTGWRMTQSDANSSPRLIP